jgi:hypothetical protein
MIVISSSLTLSAGFTADHPIIGWDNQITTANIAATASDANYPVTNLANPMTHSYWKGTSTGTQYLTHTTGSANPYSFAGIAGHNFGTGGWTVSVEEDVGSGYTEIVSGVIPGDDSPLLFRWTSGSFSGLRLKLTGGTVIPRAAVLFMGDLLVVERKVLAPHTPINFGRKIKAVAGVSESGNFLGSIVTGEGRTADIAFQNLTDTWYRQYMDDFVDYAAYRNPFFFGWLPQTFPNDIGYGWCANDPRPSIQNSKGHMQVALNVDAVA